jgi:protein SCO1/2
MSPRLLLCLGLLWLGACAPSEKPAPAPGGLPTKAEGESGERVFPLVGVVRSVDRKGGKVIIDHEAIPGYMDAMAMPFDLKGQEVLGDLQVGDKVEGRLRVSADASRLTDVTIVALADPAASVGEVTPASKTLKPGEPVPDFTMTAQSGEALRLSDLRGKTVVLTFIYTRCPLPEFCPLMDRRFGELARGLAINPEAAERVRLLSVSFDPEHDTPEVLRAHARKVGAEPPLWTVAVAGHDELRHVAGPLGLSYGPTGDQVIHSLSTAVIDPDGRLARLWTGRDWSVTEVRKLLNSLETNVPSNDGLPR